MLVGALLGLTASCVAPTSEQGKDGKIGARDWLALLLVQLSTGGQGAPQLCLIIPIKAEAWSVFPDLSVQPH